MVAVHRAVELPDPAASGGLVQAIDILGDDRKKLPLPLPPGKPPVSSVGLRLQPEHFLAVKAVELLCLLGEKAVADDLLRRIGPFLAVEPVLPPKIWNAAFRRDPGPPEKNNRPAALHQFPKPPHSRNPFPIHQNPSLHCIITLPQPFHPGPQASAGGTKAVPNLARRP